MSHLQYYAYEGFGQHSKDVAGYSQAVRIGNHIHCSGQGGWNRETSEVDPDFDTQLKQAFDNVEHNLRDAGAEGWKNVYSIRAYILDVGDESLGKFAATLKQYCPNHQPLLTGVAVKALAFDMKIELEVSAHIPDSK